MPEGRLYIGNRRYSSWSMRGWLAVKLAGLDVEEVMIHFSRPGPTEAISRLSPNGLVPYLEHRGARVWESLAVCEYCAEIAPSLWPADPVARAHARAISAEMHAGFSGLRQSMWMNLGRDFSGLGRTPEALADVARIEAMWAETRQRFGAGGPFLFGAAFTAADAMYAPVVTRFLTWQPEIGAATRAYCEAVRAHPLVSAWYDGAAAEPRNGCCPTTKTPGERPSRSTMSGSSRAICGACRAVQHLGFTLTPLARQAMAASATAARCCIGLWSCSPCRSECGSATLDRFLARYAGIHILAFAIDDPQATRALRRAGRGAVRRSLDRPIDDLILTARVRGSS